MKPYMTSEGKVYNLEKFLEFRIMTEKKGKETIYWIVGWSPGLSNPIRLEEYDTKTDGEEALGRFATTSRLIP
jgi:hypothetical protein